MSLHILERDLVFLEAATVVLAVDARSENHLAEALKGVAPQVHAIGDCVQPRDILEAMHNGSHLVYEA